MPAEYKHAYAGGMQYTVRADGKGVEMWIVSKFWAGGKCQRDSAFFREGLARARAGEIVGVEGATIGIENITVFDLPPKL